jgi:uncharacterized membrane protein YfcA
VDPLEAVILACVAFCTGVINAVAGGGTLILFPTLLAFGYTAKVANVTNTVAVWPGTVGGSLAYRAEISRQRRTIVAVAPFVLVGTLLGSALLLATPDSTFDLVVPFLIFGACFLLAAQDRLTVLFFKGDRDLASGHNLLLLRIAIFLVSLYGGYFGAAMGIIMLAIFGLLLPEDIQHANALKGLIAAAINGIGAGYFAVFGDVAWEAAAIMAVSSLAGGYFGVGLARRLPRDKLRLVAVLYGTAAGFVMLLR